MGLAPATYAEISPAELAQVGVHAPASARAPLGLGFVTPDGRATTLGAVLDGRPAVLVFEDYRCDTLCGPALSIAAAALQRSGLTPGQDFTLAAIGLNPHEPPAAAAAMRDARLPPGPLRRDAAFLTGTAPAVAAATRALGFGYAYDPQSRQFTHPVAAFVLAPDGRLTRVLSEVNLTGPQIGTAVRAARRGEVGSLGDTLALLCHGFSVAVGRFDAPVTAGLRVAAVATLALMAAGVAALIARRRRRTA